MLRLAKSLSVIRVPRFFLHVHILFISVWWVVNVRFVLSVKFRDILAILCGLFIVLFHLIFVVSLMLLRFMDLINRVPPLLLFLPSCALIALLCAIPLHTCATLPTFVCLLRSLPMRYSCAPSLVSPLVPSPASLHIFLSSLFRSYEDEVNTSITCHHTQQAILYRIFLFLFLHNTIVYAPPSLVVRLSFCLSVS